MKTKTILIKCEVPEDVNLPVKEIYFSDGKKWLKTTNAEIINPPTEIEINEASYICHDFDGARVCMKWVLKRLGL